MQLQFITCSLNDSYVVLQAVTVLVAMASRKILWTKIALKVANRRSVFSDHMPSYSRDFARSVFLVHVVSVYDLFKLK